MLSILNLPSTPIKWRQTPAKLICPTWCLQLKYWVQNIHSILTSLSLASLLNSMYSLSLILLSSEEQTVRISQYFVISILLHLPTKSYTDGDKSSTTSKEGIFFLCHKILMKCFIEVEISLIIWFTENEGRGKWVPWLIPWCTILRLKIFLMYSSGVHLKGERVRWMGPLI